jgi:hypothetical protein
MAGNKYFRNYTYGREQRQTEDLITEAIGIHGLITKYLPRTIWNEDILLGEDPLSRFDTAVDIELYVKSNVGFGGQGDFLGKFGVELRDQVVFVMSRKRWLQICTEKLSLESDGIYQQESANTGAWDNSEAFLLETATANGYSITSPRPNEGDLLYFGPGLDMFEIKFVEHENPFYPHGKKFTYEITAEKFRYSSETIATGNTEIDTQMSNLSLDLRMNELILEDGGMMLDEETSTHFIQDGFIGTQALTANNDYLKMQASGIIDFSETNPFSELDRL